MKVEFSKPDRYTNTMQVRFSNKLGYKDFYLSQSEMDQLITKLQEAKQHYYKNSA